MNSRLIILLLALSSCSSFQSLRAPASLELSCQQAIAPLLESHEVTLTASSWWRELLGRQKRETFLAHRYRETKRELEVLSLDELASSELNFGESIEFEDLVAYMDVLAHKARGEQSSDFLELLYSEDVKAERELVVLRRKVESDHALTQSEVKAFVSRYYLATLGAGPSVFRSPPKALEAIAAKAFLTQISHKSLYELFEAKSYKNPKLYQKVLDRIIRASRSRLVTLTRNIILPTLQASSGLVPLPLKEVEFVLDEEIAERILKDGLVRTWPTIQERYRLLGYTQLGFNEFARYYRPVGALGFFVTAFYLMDKNNNERLAEQSEAAEAQIMAELDKYQESAEKIVSSLDDSILEEALREFEDLYGRPPSEEEKQELLLLFAD